MANVTQIYSIVNAAVSDFLGTTAVRAKDTTSFVDLGRSLADLSTEADPYHGYDAFFGALVGRIAKTEVFTLYGILYSPRNSEFIVSFDFFNSSNVGAKVSRISF